MLWENVFMFGVKIIVADVGMAYPREGGRFLMQLFFEKGYPWEILQWLNRVHMFLPVLFLSDILTASRYKIDTKIVSQH